MRQTILVGITALALIAAVAPAVAGEDHPLLAAPASGGRAPQPSQKLSGAAQTRLGNNPNNQGRNHADQQRVGSQVRGAPVAPSINGRGMGGGRMNGGMRGRR